MTFGGVTHDFRSILSGVEKLRDAAYMARCIYGSLQAYKALHRAW